MTRRRLAVLNSHPIQYFAPLYRRLAREPWLDLTVYYCSRQGLDPYRDEGFGTAVSWDVPLVDGYRAKFLSNWARRDRVEGFFSLVNPGIVRELRREHFDALWLHGHNHCTHLLGLAAARLTRTRVLMRGETHLRLRSSRLKGLLRQAMMRRLYALCDGCLPIGSLNAEFYRHHGVASNRLFRVPYTVDNEFFRTEIARCTTQRASFRVGLGLLPDHVVILYVSKLTARKRPGDLLRAYAVLCRRTARAALVFVGSGEEEAALRETVTREQLPNVVFAGFRNQSELPMMYAAADMFVLPAENEPWGLVINEAMCGALPVVATREIGAVADLVVHGVNGLLYETGDVETLAAHLARLVEDGALRRRMGERSAERMDAWSYERCVTGIGDALRAVADR